MSKFLSEVNDVEEDEEDVQQPEQSQVSKGQKKKDKKKKKKQGDEKQPEEQKVQNVPTIQEEQKIQEQPQQEKVESKNDNDDEEDDKDGQADTQGKTKNQKKKDKKKKKPAETEKKVEEKSKPMTAIAKLALERKIQKENEERLRKEEEERLQREEDERVRKEEEELRLKQEEEERRKLEKKKKLELLKSKGEYLTKTQLAEQKRLQALRDSIQVQEVGEDKSNVVRKKKKQAKKPEEPSKDEHSQFSSEKQNEESNQEGKNQLNNEAKDIDDWENMLDEEPTKENLRQRDMIPECELKLPHQEQEEQKDQSITKHEIEQSKIQKDFRNVGEFRSPICCILGHVDTGKTTLLDKIRNTNVQEGEAGGITQQIGATFFPGKKLAEELKKTAAFYPVDCSLPGLLIIDTPGHESFSNLRSRGSSLCDLAILVIDLMHGLEKQTLESLELLKLRKTPFVIALNKIDRCFDWQKRNMASSQEQLSKQKKPTKLDYENRKTAIYTELAAQGFNVATYWENSDPNTYVSVIPTSGITGEGIPDLLTVIVKYTSIFLKKRVTLKDSFNCTVLERKVIEGFGATIDCILVDGVLRKDDQIVVQGFQGPIVTKIRAILTPHPMKELRVKGEYIHHDVLLASMGLKISANDLEDAVAGSQLYVVNDEQSLQHAKTLLQNDFDSVKHKIQLASQGVGVAASTLGSLEALLSFLKKSEVPVSYVSVGPVSKDDVQKALKNVVLEDSNRRKKEYACMLVFDVKVNNEAREYAEHNQIKIFEANIIYHLFDSFMAHVKNVQEERKKIEGKEAIFPCIFKTIAFLNKKDPLILGINIEQGVLRPNTPVCIYNEEKLKIGIVESIEANHKPLKEARSVNGDVAIRIKTDGNIQAGRHFQSEDKIVSILTRHSIDMLKVHYRDEVTLDDWQLVKDLKNFFHIP